MGLYVSYIVLDSRQPSLLPYSFAMCSLWAMVTCCAVGKSHVGYRSQLERLRLEVDPTE